MRILVLGGRGMAGHVITSYMKKQGHDVLYTTRNEDGIQLDVTSLAGVRNVILHHKPDVLINAVGLLNGDAEARLKDAIIVNGLLPHFLTEVLDEYGGKLIHISTDCVFSGEKGSYVENDEKDGTTAYSKTKAIGEVTRSPHLTIRTSIIGPELKENGIGLFHWFLKQQGEVKGYANVFWNGVTTLELAKAIDHLIPTGATGLYHLCTPGRISKYELLQLFKEVLKKDDVTITASLTPVHDKTLMHTRKDVHYPVQDYKKMLIEMVEWMRQK